MCVTAWIGDVRVDSVGVLRSALGVVVIEDEQGIRERLEGVGIDLEDTCLCAVDMTATAALAGMVLDWGADTDPSSVDIREPKV